MIDSTIKACLAEALQVCASVSEANLARRGELLHATLVDPHALRRMADLLEEIAPGAIGKVRRSLQ